MQRKTIFNEILPMFNDIIIGQQQGKVMLTHKVAYPISRMLNRGLEEQKSFALTQEELIKAYCELDEKGNANTIEVPVLGQPPRMELKFKSTFDKEEYLRISTERLEESVKFDINKIPLKELERCSNFPVLALAKLEELGLISDTKEIRLVN